MKPLVSVVVPVYKVEKYIERCVDSILNQTYKNLEILLIDDGSPDKSGEICDSYALKDKRVRVIHKNNGGLSDARNVGIDISKGKYITFVDSDDWIEKTYIEELYDLIESTNSEIAICNFLKVSDENFKKINKVQYIIEKSNIEALYELYGKFSTQFTVAWGKLYNRRLFDDIRFPYGKVHEDLYVCHKLIYKSKKVSYTNKILYYYFQRTDSITGQKFNLKNRIDEIQALKERSEFFKLIGLNDLVVKNNETLLYRYLDTIYNIYKSKKYDTFIKQIIEEFISLEKNMKDEDHRLIFRIFSKLSFNYPVTMSKFYKLIKHMKQLFK